MLAVKYIAKECNIPPTTMSKILNDSKKISAATRNRILGACESMGDISRIYLLER